LARADTERSRRVEAIRDQLPLRYRFADETKNAEVAPDLGEDGTLITGKNGRGKTHLAARIAIAKAETEAMNPVWVEVPILLARFRASFRQGSAETELDIVGEYDSPDLLILDDFGAEKATDYSMQSLYLILSRRINDLRPTVVTTNLTLAEIHAIEPRIASRLASFLNIHLDGRNWRMNP